jgi:hypothetical protein
MFDAALRRDLDVNDLTGATAALAEAAIPTFSNSIKLAEIIRKFLQGRESWTSSNVRRLKFAAHQKLRALFSK